MLALNHKQLIGKGRDRACYAHPDTPSLCVKVSLKPEKQSIRERQYLAFLSKQNVDLSLISCHRGEVETNLGKGHLFDLYRSSAGIICPTLKEAIQQNLYSKEYLLTELKTLKNYLIENAICVRDLSPNNIICATHAQGQTKFIIIDGIGSPNYNPLTIRWKPLIVRAIDKAWKRLERKIKKIDPYLYNEQ